MSKERPEFYPWDRDDEDKVYCTSTKKVKFYVTEEDKDDKKMA